MFTALALMISLSAAPLTAESAADNPDTGIHMGINAGIGSLGIDATGNGWTAFASLQAAGVLISKGDFVLGAIGFGRSVTMSSGPWGTWDLDLYGLLTPGVSRNGSNASTGMAGLGVGAGIRYTSTGGFTFAFRLPLIGFDVAHSEDVPTAALLFYGESMLGMPQLSVGYRF